MPIELRPKSFVSNFWGAVYHKRIVIDEKKIEKGGQRVTFPID